GYGSTSRNDVLGRVDVPVMPGTAARTRPVPGGKTQLGEQVPASRAGLGGGGPAGDHDERTPRPFGLVLPLPPKIPPPRITDRPRQRVILNHVGDREVFDHDRVGPADQVGAGAVQEVGAGVADLAVSAGDFGLGLAPVDAPALAAGHTPLVAGQVTG